MAEETVHQILAEMRAWAQGEGCFNDDPEGKPLPCVYWAQTPFLQICDRLEAAAAREKENRDGRKRNPPFLDPDPGHATLIPDTL